jgi:molybdopterin synthase catalytic subunit
MIKVQREDFDVGREIAALSDGNHAVGGLAVFIGLVRDMAGDQPVGAMTLEHYPGMTEKMLARIEAEARERWPLEASLVIHRYGRLEPGDRIVLVAAASAHRQAALEACQFLIDWLKTTAPFWKLEEGPKGTSRGAAWVEAQAGDDASAARWDETPIPGDAGPEAAE